MASLLQLLLFLSLPSSLVSSITPTQIPQLYVVYMGSSSSGNAEADHLQLLSSIIPSQERQRISLIHHYQHSFKGFSALLTQNEASLLSADECIGNIGNVEAGNDEIVSVFPDPIIELHTTRSWDFLEAESGIPSTFRHQHLSSDVIVGVIDTGVWPESPSFDDEGIGKIPSRWKGVCMEGRDFKKSHCNRKLIGARYYNNLPTSNGKKMIPAKRIGSARDSVGHGTHTASTAAGAAVGNASYCGLAKGTARGGLASARIAAYKACSQEGCSGSTILKAIDDAVKDGVDIISISLGMNLLFQADYLNDPIAIGAFHAVQMGVMVICSGGNDGPDPYTVVNSAPWIFTVAASNIDRHFQSTVILGNGKSIQGSGINFSNLTSSETFPLAFGEEVAANFTPTWDARNCYPGSLDPNKVEGKIIVCVQNDQSVSRRIKQLVVEDAKAKGLILIDENSKGVPFDSAVFPFAQVGNVPAFHILKYIKSTRNPRATILPTIVVPKSRPAPAVAYFSSRGPGELTENILKPDIMAPGVGILAAMIPDPEGEYRRFPNGKKPSNFGIKSGTSMACPHVTGAAAFIKSVHPRWTPSIIKSALMTTAIISNNMGKPLTNSSNYAANPHETGVGEINPLKALNPGLVFETTPQNYLQFLCYLGYPEKNIRSMSNTKFNCPKISLDDLISNMNYPSISISKINRHRGSRMVKRIVTNVGSPNVTYNIAMVHAPVGLLVKVSPNKIVFKEGIKRASFKVFFNGREASNGYNFGYITWSDGKHLVRVVFAVNVE